METKYLKINSADNVAVAITALPAGEKLIVDGKEIILNEDIPAGHKFALKDFAEGENVIKYGYPIGHARTARKQGDWMNENNIRTNLAGLLEYTYNPTEVKLDIPHKDLTFKGYRRKNGDVGVRNEIWIIPTVGCVNGIVNQLAEGLRRETDGKGVDAIMAFPAQLRLFATGRRPRKHQENTARHGAAPQCRCRTCGRFGMRKQPAGCIPRVFG